MRIFDGEADRTLGAIDLFLTHGDIEELIDVLRALQSEDVGSQYQVVERDPALRDYAHEINIALYEEGDVPADWPERAADVIMEDR